MGQYYIHINTLILKCGYTMWNIYYCEQLKYAITSVLKHLYINLCGLFLSSISRTNILGAYHQSLTFTGTIYNPFNKRVILSTHTTPRSPVLKILSTLGSSEDTRNLSSFSTWTSPLVQLIMWLVWDAILQLRLIFVPTWSTMTRVSVGR